MDIKLGIETILANPVKGIDPAIAILSFLDNAGLSLGGNGWVEDDVDALMWESNVRNYLDSLKNVDESGLTPNVRLLGKIETITGLLEESSLMLAKQGVRSTDPLQGNIGDAQAAIDWVEDFLNKVES